MPQQKLPGLHSGVKTTLTKGDPISRMMGQYGQGHSFATPQGAPTGVSGFGPAAPGGNVPGGSVPGAPAGAGLGLTSSVGSVKGGKGGLKPHVKLGGLGAGANGSYGSPRDYGAASDAG